MTAVAAYPTPTDAELARLTLWAAGIPYVIEPDAYRFGLAGGVRLLVDAADAHDASALLHSQRPTNGKD
jgi:hypothetical protein